VNEYNFVNSCVCVYIYIYIYANYAICFNVLKHLEHNKLQTYLKHDFVYYQHNKTQSCLILNKLLTQCKEKLYIRNLS
jgi:hypothetical protein